LADRSGGGGEAFTNAAGGRLLTAGSLSMKAAGCAMTGPSRRPGLSRPPTLWPTPDYS
jgi:hypothetical protein